MGAKGTGTFDISAEKKRFLKKERSGEKRKGRHEMPPFPFDKKIKNCYEIYACRRAAVPASVLAGAAGRTACMFFTVMVMIVVGTSQRSDRNSELH